MGLDDVTIHKSSDNVTKNKRHLISPTLKSQFKNDTLSIFAWSLSYTNNEREKGGNQQVSFFYK